MTNIAFVPQKRESSIATGKPRMVTDYGSLINNERRGIWRREMFGHGYELRDAMERTIKDPDIPDRRGRLQTAAIKLKEQMLPETERLLAAGAIPTVAEIEMRKKIEAKSIADRKAAEQAERLEYERTARLHEVAPDLLAFCEKLVSSASIPDWVTEEAQALINRTKGTP